MEKKKSVKIQKRKKIIDKAWELFIKNGYEETKVEDITRELGISKGSFYTYFATKDELLYEILEKIKKKVYTSLGSSWEQEHSDEVEADFKKIQRTVTLHHIPSDNEKQIDDSILFVKTADMKAREKEKELYFNDFIPWRDDVKDKITESIMSEQM